MTGGAMSPNGGADQAQAMQAWAAYYAANPSADPYAAYGGYGQVMSGYMQNPGAYYQQGQGVSQSPGHMNGAAGAPPSLHAQAEDGGAPPPPPPPGAPSNGGGYTQVCSSLLIHAGDALRMRLTLSEGSPAAGHVSE